MTLSHRSKGLIIILSSPSGGGKSSLARALIHIDHHLRLSISVTTRPPRPGEVDGVDYHFKTKEEFTQLIQQNMFLEYAKIYDHYYGTLKQHVDDLLNQGLDVIFDIDWQGARSIKSIVSDAVTIFILPPTREVLEQRMRERGQDTPEAIEMRLKESVNEIPHAKEYDHVVTNDDFDVALANIHSIIRAKREHRR